MRALHLLQSSLVSINPCMSQRVLREDTWEQRMMVDNRRTLTPLIDGQVHPDGTCLLHRHTRLDLERPAATSPMGGGAGSRAR